MLAKRTYKTHEMLVGCIFLVYCGLDENKDDDDDDDALKYNMAVLGVLSKKKKIDSI